MDWSPLLTGEECSRARDICREIAVLLGSNGASFITGGGAHCSLACGASSTAVLFSYLHRSGCFSVSERVLAEFLGYSISFIEATELPPALFGGFTGVAWALDYCTAGDGCSTDEIDDALLGLLRAGEWTRPIDLINGLVGLGLYSLSRTSETSRQCVTYVIEHLERLSTTFSSGIAWLTAPQWLPRSRLAEFPDGYYDLGVAHGSAGVIGFLARALKAGFDCRRLLEEAVSWLLAHRYEGVHRYPVVVDLRSGIQTAPGGWCSGDLGISLGLLDAAEALDSNTIREEAIRTGRCALGTMEQLARFQDACFCHGTAGVAHIAARLFHRTHDKYFSEKARHWLRETLAMSGRGDYFGGYAFYQAVSTESPVGYAIRFDVISNSCLLSGVVGVALVLASAVSEYEPRWDQILMCS